MKNKLINFDLFKKLLINSYRHGLSSNPDNPGTPEKLLCAEGCDAYGYIFDVGGELGLPSELVNGLPSELDVCETEVELF